MERSSDLRGPTLPEAGNARVRLLAVLAADAVGYSRHMSEDDRGTVLALQLARAAFRDAIDAQGGRVVDMAGDSVLAVFDNATAAVAASLQAQERLESAKAPRQLRFRVGVHLGDVIEQVDGSVYGDGVNIAARLQALAAAGSVAVSDAVRATVKGRIQARFEDLGAQRVKNIAEAVRAWAVTASARAPSRAASAQDEDVAPEATQPSVAVLPFNSGPSGPSNEQDWFADGLVDDVIGTLAQVPDLVVIARSSTLSYKGRSVDARSVAQELNVRYVVEGALRIQANRLRVNVGLVDCQTLGQLWSERFDTTLEDVFAVQDELSARIINSLRSTIVQAEARASRKLPARNLRAWQIRAQVLDLYHQWNRAAMLRAIELMRGALVLAPDEAPNHVYLATMLWATSISGWGRPGGADFAEAQLHAQRALNLDENLAPAHNIMASILNGLGRNGEALAAAERCIELSPGDFMSQAQLGQTLAFAGRYEQALTSLDRAQRLSPRDPSMYWVWQSRSIALFGLERYAEALAAAQRVTRQLPEWVNAYLMMAAAHAALEQPEPARTALAQALSLDPRMTIRRYIRRQAHSDQSVASRLATFLRDAGLAN